MKAAFDALSQRNKLDMVSADYTKESIENSAEALTGLEQSKKQMENQARMAEGQKPAASQAGAGQNNKVQADNKKAEIKSPADKKKKEDDLFEQGLTSLDTVKIVTRCGENGYAIEMKDIYMTPTFDELVKAMKPGE